MIQVHLSDGRTLKFDLSDREQRDEWVRLAKDSKFQSSVRAVTLQDQGVRYSFTRPSGFSRVWVFSEYLPPDSDKGFRGGERVTIQSDAIRSTLLVHAEQKAARIDMIRLGRQCYNPLMDK